MHRAEQDAKDKKFFEMLKSIEMESAGRNHSVNATKEALVSNSKAEAEKKLAKVQEENKRSLQLDDKASQELLGRLAETFRTLELASSAHELDQWCDACGCIHTADVVREDNI